MKSLDPKPIYAPFIDGLRAIAVLSVIIYHLNANWLPGGFAGVDIFFVISGFVVSTSVSDIGRVNPIRLTLYFYARRLARILPALVAVLLVTFFVSALFIPRAWLTSANRDTGVFAFFGLSNFVLARDSGNYFSPTAEFNPFTHTWSLGVEEQFYLVFPMLFFAWLWARRRVSIAIFAFSLLASLGVAVRLSYSDENQAFYMIWSRFWELASGVLLFQVMAARGHSFTSASPNTRIASIGAVIAAIALIAGLMFARADRAPFPASVLPVLGTLGLLCSLHGRDDGFLTRLLTVEAARFVGKISYSLYLWHWPVDVLFRWTVGLETPVFQLAAAVATGLLSVASYYLVEAPPRRLARRLPHAATVAATITLAVSGYRVANLIETDWLSISLSTVAQHAAQWYPEGPGIDSGFSDCKVNSQELKFADGQFFLYSRIGCAAPATFKHQIFVVGDSHLHMYILMFKQFSAQTGATVGAYFKDGCPFMSLHLELPSCTGFGRAAIADMLPKIRPGDIVFLPSLRLLRMIDQWASFGEADVKARILGTVGDEERKSGVLSAIPILRELSARGAKIVFEGPPPILKTIPFRCADWFNRRNPICKDGDTVSRALLTEMRAPILRSYEQMAEAVPGVTVWDPFPLLCPGEQCMASDNGTPLFFDGDHISGYSNLMLLPSFSKFVQDLD